MTVQDKDTLKTYFNTGDVPNEQNYFDLIDTIFEGVGGIKLDSILLIHSDGSSTEKYPITVQGLLDSLTNSGDRDLILVPNSDFGTDIFIPEGVKLVSFGDCVINGKVTLSDRSEIGNCTISPSGNSESYVVGVTGTGSGISYVNICKVVPTNSGIGGVAAAYAINAYSLKIRGSFLDGRGNSGGGNGYAAFRTSGSNIYIEGGTCLGADPDNPFNE